MSTLTKTLIILLTLSSIFLCAIVVTYVSSANNFKDQLKTESTRRQTAESRESIAKADLAKKSDQFEKDLKDNIAKDAVLTKQLDDLDDEIEQLKTALTTANQKAANSAALAKTSGEISNGLQQTLNEKLAELKQSDANGLYMERQLEEVNAELITRIAVIDALQADKRRLEEAKTQLQMQLDRLLGRRGIEVSPVKNITLDTGLVKPAPPTVTLPDKFTKPIALKASLTDVNIENSLAQISIGSANGVRTDMKFLVTRDSQFICEILIIDVEPEMAVGLIQRVKAGARPKIGDNAATNLQ